jgi:hypothetical protein
MGPSAGHMREPIVVVNTQGTDAENYDTSRCPVDEA